MSFSSGLFYSQLNKVSYIQSSGPNICDVFGMFTLKAGTRSGWLGLCFQPNFTASAGNNHEKRLLILEMVEKTDVFMFFWIVKFMRVQ